LGQKKDRRKLRKTRDWVVRWRGVKSFFHLRKKQVKEGRAAAGAPWEGPYQGGAKHTRGLDRGPNRTPNMNQPLREKTPAKELPEKKFQADTVKPGIEQPLKRTGNAGKRKTEHPTIRGKTKRRQICTHASGKLTSKTRGSQKVTLLETRPIETVRGKRSERIRQDVSDKTTATRCLEKRSQTNES